MKGISTKFESSGVFKKLWVKSYLVEIVTAFQMHNDLG